MDVLLMDLLSAPVTAGDVVCGFGASTVGRADADALVKAGIPLGVAIHDALPGAAVFVATSGVIPATLTGLPAGNAGPVGVIGGRAVRITARGSEDYLIGIASESGALWIWPESPLTLLQPAHETVPAEETEPSESPQNSPAPDDTASPPPGEAEPTPSEASWRTLELSGIDSGVVFPGATELRTRGSMTLELWIRPDAWSGLDGPTPLYHAGGSGSLQLDSSGLLRFVCQGTRGGIQAEGRLETSGPLPLWQWTHVALVRDGQTLTFYLNGLPDTSGATGLDRIEPTDTPISLGCGPKGTWALRGGLAEVRVWSGVRTPDQIRAWRKRRISGREAHLLAYWPLDEGEGSWATDRSDTRLEGVIHGGHWATMPKELRLRDEPRAPLSQIPCIQTDGHAPIARLMEPDALRLGGNVTIEFFIRVDKPARRAIWHQGPRAHIWLHENGTLFWGYSGSDAWFRTPLPLGRWVHVSLVRNLTPPDSTFNRELVFYLNGERVSWFYPDVASPDVSSIQEIIIGGGLSEAPFAGAICDFRVWTEARTPDQIKATCARRLTPEEAKATAAYWPMDDGAALLRDLGPNGIHLPASGSVQWSSLPAKELAWTRSTSPTGCIRLGPGESSLTASAPIALSGSFTIECWIRPRDLNQYLKVQLADGPGFQMRYQHRHWLELSLGDGAARATARIPSVILDEGIWQHVALVRDSLNGRLELFLDGNRHYDFFALDASVSGALARVAGSASGHQPMNADVSELRVWSVARSAAQVCDDRVRRVQGDEPGLAAAWSLDSSGANRVPGCPELVTSGDARWVLDGPACLAEYVTSALPSVDLVSDAQPPPVPRSILPSTNTHAMVVPLSLLEVTSTQHHSMAWQPPEGAVRIYSDRDEYWTDDATAHVVVSFFRPYKRHADRLEVSLLNALGELVEHEVVRLPLEWRGKWPRLELLVRLQRLPVGVYTLQVDLVDDLERCVDSPSLTLKKVAQRHPEIQFPAEGVALIFDCPESMSSGNIPISTGISMPFGTLWDTNDLVILEDGQPIPSQIVPRAFWQKEGSISWLGADFIAQWQDGKALSYRLGRGQASSTALRVTQQSDRFVIETGTARFEVGTRGFPGILSAARASRAPTIQGIGGPYVVDESDQLFAAAYDSDATVELEVEGPVRVVLVARGWYRSIDQRDSFCRFITRLSFHADKSTAEIEHHTIVTYDTRESRRIRDAGWQIGTSFDNSVHWRSHIDGAVQSGELGTGHPTGVSVHQLRHDRVRLLETSGATETERVHGRRSDGDLLAEANKEALALHVRDFWQRFPNELEVDSDPASPHVGDSRDARMVVHFWPRHGIDTFSPEEQIDRQHIAHLRFAHQGRDLDFNYPATYLEALNQWPDEIPGDDALDAARRGSAQGVSFGGSFQIELLPLNTPSTDLLEATRLFQEAPHATPEPQWFALSEVEGPVLPYVPGRLERLEHFLQDTIPAYTHYAVDIPGEYGKWIYGHVHNNWFPGKQAPELHRLFSNSHYRNVFSGWLLYLRSAHKPLRAWARVNADAYFDTGTVHHFRKGPYEAPQGSVMHAYGVMPWSNENWYADHWVDVGAYLIRYLVEGQGRGRDLMRQWLAAFDGGGVLNPARYLTREIASQTTWLRNYVTTLGELVRCYQATRDPHVLFMMRECAFSFMDMRFDWTGVPTHAWFHDVWMFHYYALARDPRIIDQLRRVLDDGPDHQASSAFLYRTTGDKRYLERAIKPLILNTALVYDAPDDPLDGLSQVSSAIGVNILLEALYAVPAMLEAGMDLDSFSSPGTYPSHATSTFHDGWFGLSGAGGWSVASMTLLIAARAGEGFSLTFKAGAALNYDISGPWRLERPPAWTPPEQWGKARSAAWIGGQVNDGGRTTVSSGAIEAASAEGRTLTVHAAPESGAYRFEWVAGGSAHAQTPIVRGLNGKDRPSEAAVIRGREAPAMCSGRVDAWMRLFDPQGSVTLRFAATPLDNAIPGRVLILDGNGKEVCNTTLCYHASRKSFDVILDPERHPAPWHLKTYSYSNLYMQLVEGANELFVSHDADALEAVLSALRAEGKPDACVRGSMWIEPQAALQNPGDQTIELWVCPESLGAPCTLYHRHPRGEGWLRLEADGQVVFELGMGSSGEWLAVRPTGLKLEAGVWVHLAVVTDRVAGRLRVLKNGEIIHEAAITPGKLGPLPVLSDGAFIGRLSNSDYFHGLLSECRVWDRARATDKIANDYRRYLTGKEPGLIACFPIREPGGRETRDVSGHGLTGYVDPMGWLSLPKGHPLVGG